MKSIGERLVARLKSWRSRKKSILPDAGPAASESAEQLDPVLPTRRSIKVTTKMPDEGDDKTTRQVEPVAFSEVLSSAEEPKVSQEAPIVVELERNEELIDEAAALPPVPKSPPERPRGKGQAPRLRMGR